MIDLPSDGDEAYQYRLKKLINRFKKPGIRILEVGSRTGVSTAIFAEVAKQEGGKVVVVDDWFMPTEKVLFEQNMRKYWDVLEIHHTRSEKFLPTLPDCSFDFIYLDADHRYDPVKQDIEQIKRLIKPGGMICGHDCWFGLKSYDREWLEANKDEHHTWTETKIHVFPGVYLAMLDIFEGKAEIDVDIWSMVRSW